MNRSDSDRSKKLEVYFGLYESSLLFIVTGPPNKYCLCEANLISYMYVFSLRDQDVNLLRKIAVWNLGCIFVYFCGEHKSNFLIWFCGSSKLKCFRITKLGKIKQFRMWEFFTGDLFIVGRFPRGNFWGDFFLKPYIFMILKSVSQNFETTL